jgi:hypothetical protein
MKFAAGILIGLAVGLLLIASFFTELEKDGTAENLNFLPSGMMGNGEALRACRSPSFYFWSMSDSERENSSVSVRGSLVLPPKRTRTVCIPLSSCTSK